jgi:hypothetical protein
MIKNFALICWLLWGSLIFAASSGAMAWLLAVVIGAAVYVLWHLYRRAALAYAQRADPANTCNA